MRISTVWLIRLHSYIPVKVDYTDLYDILVFFMGRSDGENDHDHLGKKIAQQGQDWAKHHWRLEDMQGQSSGSQIQHELNPHLRIVLAAYLLRLFLEYGRLLHRDDEDPTSADYVPA